MGKRSEHRDSRNLYPLKNFLVKLATLVVSLVLAFAAFLAYSAWRESRAAAAAHAFDLDRHFVHARLLIPELITGAGGAQVTQTTPLHRSPPSVGA